MNEEEKKLTIGEKVAEAIISGQVHMKPRWHFVFLSALAVVGGVILGLTAIYLTSFVLFYCHQTGILATPVLGFRGWYVFMRSLPWFLISLLVVFLVILEVLVRRFSFAYRWPLFYSTLGVILILFVGGIIFATIPFHGRFYKMAEEKNLPIAGGFYRHYGMERFRDLHRGKIEGLKAVGFDMRTRRGKILEVIVTPDTIMPPRRFIFPGQMVVVIGAENGGQIEAVGVRPVGELLGGQ